MQFCLILAVLFTLVVAENAAPQAAESIAMRIFGVISLMAVAPLVAAVIARRTVDALDRGENRTVVLDRFEKLRLAHMALWLATVAAALYFVRWPQVVRYDLGLNGSVLLDELLVLAPLLVPLVLSWAAFYDVMRAADDRPAKTAGRHGTLRERVRHVDLQFRHNLALWLLPLLALVAIQDVIGLARPGWFTSEQAAWALIVPVALLFLFFPWMLSGVWRARPLEPGPLRSRLEAVARRHRFRARDILVWRTDGTVVNAAVAGLAPSLRYVYLSDGLISHLSEDEIEAVYGHELGHVVHHHLVARLVILLAPLSLWMLFRRGPAGSAGTLPAWVEGLGVSGQEHGAVLGVAAMGAYLLLAFGFLSRRLEQQADLFGCRAASAPSSHRVLELGGAKAETQSMHPTAEGVATFVSALEKLASLNGVRRSARGWQHGSIARRVAFLERVARHPGHAQWFTWRLRGTMSLLFGIVAGSILWQWL